MFELESLADQIRIQRCDIPLFAGFNREIFLVRLDAIRLGSGGRLTGNKVFKLQPVLSRAKRENIQRLISFGGAWSNHLHALAALGQHYGLATVGVVRGERKPVLTPTLSDCRAMGMQLHFVSRADYQRLQTANGLADLQQLFGDGRHSMCSDSMIVPVGGTDSHGLQGAVQMGALIAQRLPSTVDDIWLAGATGGTAAGMIAAAAASSASGSKAYNGQVSVVNVLAHCELAHDITGCLQQIAGVGADQLVEKGTVSQAWRVLNEYHCGGYARVNKALMDFHKQLEMELNELVDQVYMAKVLFGLWLNLKALQGTDNHLGQQQPHGAIAVIHSGGQQGRRSFL